MRECFHNHFQCFYGNELFDIDPNIYHHLFSVGNLYQRGNLPNIDLRHLYRALDKLDTNSNLIQQDIFQMGRDLFNSKLDVVFYDVTTFYFESDVEKEGELRQMGFEKNCKIGHTQILFSMLIYKDKNPIGYRVY